MPTDNRVRIVEATPVSHAPDHTRFDIPSWELTYPITIYRMEAQQQRMLPLHQTQVMLLLARSLKHGKSPDLRENWNWQFIRLASEEEAKEYYRKNQPVRRAEVKMTGPAGMSPNEVYRHRSIQRQTALKLAVKHVHRTSEEPAAEAIVELAELFAGWIEEGITNSCRHDDAQPEGQGENGGADDGAEREWAIPSAEKVSDGTEAPPADDDIMMVPEDDDSPPAFLDGNQDEPSAAAQPNPEPNPEPAAEPAQPEGHRGDPSETEWMQG